MRGFRAVLLCSCVWVACISDLKPDVGELNTPTEDVGEVGEGQGGTGNAGGNANGASTSAAEDAALDVSPDAGEVGGVGGENDAGAVMPVDGCKVKDSNPAKDVSFAQQIKPILAACTCHNPNDQDPFAILESGLTIDGYKSFRMGGDNTGAKIIIAGNACDSIVLQKLSETPPFGDRMPRDGPYLSLAERTLISDWIVEGARDN